MRYLNLQDVTAATTRLLELNVTRLLGGGPTPVPVTNLPPELAGEADVVCLNFYLYHVAHDAEGGNEMAPGMGGRYPIATRPMPLKLYYVMTAHGPRDADTTLIGDQQALMGWGMKTFHDFPVIDALLMISGKAVLGSLEDRTIEVILRPTTPEESVSFWSVDQVRSARLAAFYEVRTALLPPEPAANAAGTVTDVALRVDPGGRPSLTGTSVQVSFVRPAALGGGNVSTIVTPAIVALRSGAPTAEMRVAIAGSDLGDGSDLSLVLRGGALPGQGLPGDAAVLTPGDNADWSIGLTIDGMIATVRPTAQAASDGGVLPVEILPGNYTVAARRRMVLRTEGNTERVVEAESNRVALSIAPNIVSAALDASKHVILKVSPGYKVKDPRAEPQMSIAGQVYRLVTAFTGTLATDRGTFIATNPGTYEAVPLFDPALAGKTYAIRLGVNGVDAQPFWIAIP